MSHAWHLMEAELVRRPPLSRAPLAANAPDWEKGGSGMGKFACLVFAVALTAAQPHWHRNGSSPAPAAPRRINRLPGRHRTIRPQRRRRPLLDSDYPSRDPRRTGLGSIGHPSPGQLRRDVDLDRSEQLLCLGPPSQRPTQRSSQGLSPARFDHGRRSGKSCAAAAIICRRLDDPKARRQRGSVRRAEDHRRAGALHAHPVDHAERVRHAAARMIPDRGCRAARRWPVGLPAGGPGLLRCRVEFARLPQRLPRPRTRRAARRREVALRGQQQRRLHRVGKGCWPSPALTKPPRRPSLATRAPPSRQKAASRRRPAAAAPARWRTRSPLRPAARHQIGIERAPGLIVGWSRSRRRCRRRSAGPRQRQALHEP